MKKRKPLLITSSSIGKSETRFASILDGVKWLQIEKKLKKPDKQKIVERIRERGFRHIYVMGAEALKLFTTREKLTERRGQIIKQDGFKLFITFNEDYIEQVPSSTKMILNDLTAFETYINNPLIKNYNKKKEYLIKPRIIHDLTDEFKFDVKSCKEISYDLETSGLNPFEPGSWITSIGIGTVKNNWTIPLNHRLGKYFEKPYQQRCIVREIVESLKDKIVIGHNGKFDVLWSKVILNQRLTIHFDTLLASYNLDENSPHDLTFLSGLHFQASSYDIPLPWKHGIEGSLEAHCEYLAKDIYYTRKLYLLWQKKFKKDPESKMIFDQVTMPVARMYEQVELNGVYINPQGLIDAKEYWKEITETSLKKLNKICPSDQVWKDKKTKKEYHGINWNSPNQIEEFMFHKYNPDNEYGLHKKSYLNLTPINKTPKDKNSVNESTLKQIPHPIGRLILKYREASKNISTFIDSWKKRSFKGFIHPTFKVHGTVTGRPSCEDPNLQQTPRDPRIRGLVQAPEGWELVDADYSQVELRIAAFLADEQEMLNCFRTGIDIHWRTLMDIIEKTGAMRDLTIDTAEKYLKKEIHSFSTCIETVFKMGPIQAQSLFKEWKEARKLAKAVNFGYLYGMWWKKFIQYALDNYEVVVSAKNAELNRTSFFQLYPGLEPWHRRQINFVKHYGYVLNPFGRKRRLPLAMRRDGSYETKAAERQAINSPVQSFASDLNLTAAVELQQTFPRWYFKICGTVHDNILMLIKKSHLEYCLPRIYKIMKNPTSLKTFGVNFTVPIEVEIETGPWGNGKLWTP